MMKMKHNQQGFSLFMVMIMMIVIALLVVITSQSTSTESRMSANEADRKFALSEAEIGLRDGETFLNEAYDKIVKMGTSTTAGTGLGLKFTEQCQGDPNTHLGLCAPVEDVEPPRNPLDTGHFEIIKKTGKIDTAAWERPNIFEANSSRLSSNKKARYIIEYMGQRENPSGSAIHDYFRITSRANGENQNTVVTLQSYVEMTRSY